MDENQLFLTDAPLWPYAENGRTMASAAKTKIMEKWELSFPPEPPPADAKGRARQWPHSPEQWDELYEKAKSMGDGPERVKMLEDYGVNPKGAVLNWLAGKAGRSEPASAAKGSKKTTTAQARPKSKEEMLNGLEEQLQFHKDEVERHKKLIAQLTALDDDMLKLIGELQSI